MSDEKKPTAPEAEEPKTETIADIYDRVVGSKRQAATEESAPVPDSEQSSEGPASSVDADEDENEELQAARARLRLAGWTVKAIDTLTEAQILKRAKAEEKRNHDYTKLSTLVAQLQQAGRTSPETTGTRAEHVAPTAGPDLTAVAAKLTKTLTETLGEDVAKDVAPALVEALEAVGKQSSKAAETPSRTDAAQPNGEEILVAVLRQSVEGDLSTFDDPVEAEEAWRDILDWTAVLGKRQQAAGERPDLATNFAVAKKRVLGALSKDTTEKAQKKPRPAAPRAPERKAPAAPAKKLEGREAKYAIYDHLQRNPGDVAGARKAIGA